jgi:mono/diheme cytochrome c family protein
MLTLASLATLAAAGARAQEDVGDPEAGFAVASEICASCHAITREQTSHPTMPNIILEPEDLRNVVAYILSLKDVQ